MAEPVNLNTIEQLQRAIFAHLHPLSGTRGTGNVTVTSLEDEVVLPVNTYLLPLIDNRQIDYTRPFKVAPNPATVAGNGTGGDWTVPAAGTLSVAIKSNAGGAIHNLPAGNLLRFDPPVPGLAPTVTLDASISDASNIVPAIEGLGELEGAEALVRRMVFWEQLGGVDQVREFFSAGAGDFPAMLLAWVASIPLQGRTSGGPQGNTRVGRTERAFREGFVLYCGSADLSDPTPRRNKALVLMQAASRLLTDRQMNVDLEYLATMGGGIEITGRRLAFRAEQAWVYQITFEANQMLEQVDIARTFNPWRKTAMEIDVPGREAPEPTDPLPLVDVIDTML
jgi:hypothetical protein